MSILQSKIGIGTVQFGVDYGISNKQGKTSTLEVEKILEFASEKGVMYLDTAYAYGNAEDVLGKFNLSKFRVISKYIPKENISLEEQLNTSLNRLKVDALYGYMAHRPLDLLSDNGKNLEILVGYKSKGYVQKVGASFNSVNEIQPFLDNGINLDIIQFPYNYLDRRFEQIMKILKAKGCEIHTRSAFMQGLFFCDVNSLSSFFNEIKSVLKQIQNYPNLSGQLLKFVLEKDFVDVANIGVNNLAQLQENLKNISIENLALPEIEQNVNPKILMPSEWPK